MAGPENFSKSYRGEITVESTNGNGCTFKVYLPRVVSETTPIDQTIDTPASVGEGRILLVDDEKPICSMIEQMLSRLGYMVTACTSSPDALEQFKKTPDKFDLLITDLTMPDLTGDVLASKIKEINPDLPVILCTGFSEKFHDQKTADIKADAILMKPVLKADMAKAIHNILNK